MGREVRIIVANIVIIASLIAALVEGLQGDSARAAWLMTNAIFLELCVQA